MINNLPTGTVTFLFTDIEGSTKLWQEQPEAMAVAHARHDEILRTAIESNHGYVFQIVGLARALVGHLRGGLANVTVVSNMIMGGISGSSVADCSALGSILIPAMQKQGYQSRFAGAVNATASTMGIIIPPSIPMILTGAATSLSIRDLFFGGLVPGILIGLGMLVITTYISKRRDYPKFPRATARELLKAIWRGLPAFIMVAIILVGIMTGIFTPTEASVAAVLYAILVGLIDRELTWKGFYDSVGVDRGERNGTRRIAGRYQLRPKKVYRARRVPNPVRCCHDGDRPDQPA